MQVDHLSLVTSPVFLFQEEKLISQGTGFYFLHFIDDKNVLFLVTNYHVLTGVSPTENTPPIGDSIVFQFHLSKDDTGVIKNIRFPLYTKNQDPVWIKNPSFSEADLAIIPLPTSVYADAKINCISAEWTKGDLKVRPTSQVTLIGYPYGFYDKKNALPLWKTGSVASEPEVDFEGKPLFLIDVSAFPGMSGSPVFAISYGMYEREEGGTVVGGIRKFLGIYASMQTLEERKYLEQLPHDLKTGIVHTESLELGHVWKAKLIVDTINSVDVEEYCEKILRRLV